MKTFRDGQRENEPSALLGGCRGTQNVVRD